MKFINKAIQNLFLSLFLITPLIFTSWNSELFEVPKMFFVYTITSIILTLHFLNFLQKRSPLFSKNITTIPLLLFIFSQIISTFLSIDPHTSFYGYYSRLNGGLLSTLTYGFLSLIFPLYIDKKFIDKLINFSILTAFLVSIYAIAQHLGVDNNKWIQDVQNRVFSTFGQPNWLAAYLAVILPLGIWKNISEYNKKYINTIVFALINISIYISILYTKSKSGIIASTISLAVLFIFYLSKRQISNYKPVIFSIATVIILTLTIKNPISERVFPKKIITPPIQSKQENILITSSQDLRKIVWKGSIDLWKKFPIFGTGVETFAYTYYWTRPVEHNITSEWDFLYNKAHNEYLNFLATTGIIGFISYLGFLISLIFLIIKSKENIFFKISIFASILSIIITNFAGFSVVIISLYLFLLPLFLIEPIEIKNTNNQKNNSIFILISLIIGFVLLQKISTLYLADIAYNECINSEDKSDYQSAYQNILAATNFFPTEPNYQIKLASISSKIAYSYSSKEDKVNSDIFVAKAVQASSIALKISPSNTNLWKENAQIYYYLSSINTEYFRETINSLLKVTALAPTDAKTYYLLGQFLEIAKSKENAIKYYQKAIELKSNYDYAYFNLASIYFEEKNYTDAKTNFEKVIQIAPSNQEAKDYLDKIKEFQK